MKFNKLINALRPNFERTQLIEAVDDMFDNLGTLSNITQLDPAVNASFKETFPSMHRSLDRHKSFGGNVLKYLNKIITDRSAERSDLIEYIEKLYAPDVMKVTFDFERTNVMALLNAMAFFIDTTTQLVTSLAIKAVALPSVVRVSDKDTFELLESPITAANYSTAVLALENSFKDLRSIYKGMRDISFSEEDFDVAKGMINGSEDPLKTGLLPVVGHFILYFGYRVNKYRSALHEQRKEEIMRLTQTNAYLSRKREGATSEELSRIERQIAAHSARIDKLRAKVELLEESYR